MELPAPTTGLEARRLFRAFNTDVSIEATDWTLAASLSRPETFLHAFEAQFSRFLPDSELSRINNRDVDAVSVSPEMLELLERCRRFWRLTGGVFNPLILRSLESAGYDRSFEQIPHHAGAQQPSPVPPLSLLQLDTQRRRLRLPLPWGLDLGGIGKGFAVGRAAELVRAEATGRGIGSEGGFLIDAGGDIYAAGAGPDGMPWSVEVADPREPESCLATVELRDEAIATSWTTRRRWRAGEGWAHHLIDPRNGSPARSGVIGATVIAGAADEADVFAKTALILGAADGVAFLEEQRVEGLLVLQNGEQVRTSRWRGSKAAGRPEHTKQGGIQR